MKKLIRYKLLAIIGLTAFITPLALHAQTRECASEPDTATFYCGANTGQTLPQPPQGTPCTKTVTQGPPTCSAHCPSGAIECFCTFTNGTLSTTTYTGTVIWTPVVKPSWLGLFPPPVQDCGGNCFNLGSTTVGYGLSMVTYNCADCSTVGTGVPGTIPGQVCTSSELFGG
jgi:hypothetical protein